MKHEMDPVRMLCKHCHCGGGPPPTDDCPARHGVWVVFRVYTESDGWKLAAFDRVCATQPPGMRTDIDPDNVPTDSGGVRVGDEFCREYEVCP